MKAIFKGMILALCSLVCLNTLVACKPDDNTTAPNSETPSPYADLAPSQVYVALQEAEHFKVTAYFKSQSTDRITMTRKILHKNGGLYRNHTESYDGKQAVRSTVYSDTEQLRTYEKTNGKWEYFAKDFSDLSIATLLNQTLKVSDLYPLGPLFEDANYDITDSETSVRSMSEGVISSFLDAQKTSVSFSYDAKTDTYTIDGVATTKGEKGITIKNTLKIDLCFAMEAITLPAAENGELYPDAVPENIYQQILQADQLNLVFSGGSGTYTLLRSDNRFRIRILEASAGTYGYCYDLSDGTYYVYDNNKWYATDSRSVLSFAEILPQFNFSKHFYLFDASNYEAPQKGATEVSFTQAARTAHQLKSAYYTYNAAKNEHKFTCISSNDTKSTFTVSFAPQTVNFPDVQPDPLFHMTPAELKDALHQPGRYNIVKMIDNYYNQYTVQRDGNLVQVYDKKKDKTVYYDLDAHTVYTKKSGKWVCSADSSKDRWQEIIELLELDHDTFYDDSLYLPLDFAYYGQTYQTITPPAGMKSLSIQCNGLLYSITSNFENGSPFGRYLGLVIEFNDVEVILPATT